MLEQNILTVPEIIQAILQASTHDNMLEFIFAVLWMLWKSRNDLLFNSINQSPLQVIHGAKALFQTEAKTFQMEIAQDPVQNTLYKSVYSMDSKRIKEGPNIFIDAAWKEQNPLNLSCVGPGKHAGLEVFIYAPRHHQHKTIFLQATSVADSALQLKLKPWNSQASLLQDYNFFIVQTF